ncbi:MAG TPA: hypothetical protein VIV55_07045 [Flavobacterium sp.]
MKLLQKIKSYFKMKDDFKNEMTESEILEFKENLRNVIGWTEKLSENFDFENGKFGFVFRKTNPIFNGAPLYNFGRQSTEIDNLNLSYDFGEDYSSWNDWDYSIEKYELLLDLAIKSRKVDRQINLSNLDELGRILSFQTCITTHDGAPIVESKNFVDEGDIPPIDTWFFLKKNYFHSEYKCEQSLFCWIPKKFEKVIQQAIDVEILDSYRWFDENDKHNYERIKNSR